MARRAKQPGSGCVAPRPSKKHGTVYQIRWKINQGRVHAKIVGPDRREAEQELALKLAEINRGTYQERHDATFLEFVSSWFADHKSRLRPSAAERVRIDLEVHLVPFFRRLHAQPDRLRADRALHRREGRGPQARR